MKKKRHKQKQEKPAGLEESASVQERPEPAARSPKRGGPRSVSIDDVAEPRVGRSVPLPMMLVVLLGVLFYAADMYVMNNSGGFHARVYYPLVEMPPIEGVVDGGPIYNNYCSACHQPNGSGSAALNFPPLADSDWVQAEGPNRLIRVVLNGLKGPIEVSGKPWNNPTGMLPWRDTMSDEEIAAVLTYIRSSWGNEASAVTPEQVKAIRDATADRGGSWTGPELMRVPVSD